MGIGKGSGDTNRSDNHDVTDLRGGLFWRLPLTQRHIQGQLIKWATEWGREGGGGRVILEVNQGGSGDLMLFRRRRNWYANHDDNKDNVICQNLKVVVFNNNSESMDGEGR